ncbi:MAG: hypothetical protein QG597_3556 [Actinomycetota bacterium]|nr:hypothetical protein [Actinomycetota bacterium]
MSRIPWSTYEGNDIEAVVSMMLCREHPSAVHVRPSRGDGGVDIFVPGPAGGSKERAVYQVKKFAENLKSSQKNKIRASYDRVVQTSAREGWHITEWNLVMPLDLTDANLHWFYDFTSEADFPCHPKGLDYCNMLAATYPEVIDYYLRDGKERVLAAVENLTALVSERAARQAGEALSAVDVQSDLVTIYRALNANDPFYTYEFAASDKLPSGSPSVGPTVVAIWAVEQDSVCITITIRARCRAALTEGPPIGAQFKIAWPDDPAIGAQLQRFIDYGGPLSLPEGIVQGTVDMPGGLGGEVKDARLTVLTIPDEACSADDAPHLKVAILAADCDAVLAETTLTRTERSRGKTGVRVFFTERSGVFTVEMLLGVTPGSPPGSMSISMNYAAVVGKHPADVVNGFNVLAHLRAPNRVAFSAPFGPPAYNVVAGETTGHSGHAEWWAELAAALALLQDHTPTRLAMPAEISDKNAHDIVVAAQLAAGQPLSEIMPPFTIDLHRPHPFTSDPSTVYDFRLIRAVGFELAGNRIEVGKKATFLRGRCVPLNDARSQIEPVSEGMTLWYTGDRDVADVAVRLIGESDREFGVLPAAERTATGSGEQ